MGEYHAVLYYAGGVKRYLWEKYINSASVGSNLAACCSVNPQLHPPRTLEQCVRSKYKPLLCKSYKHDIQLELVQYEKKNNNLEL